VTNPTLASVSDLTSYLGGAALDATRAQLVLELATGLIQSETQQTLFKVTGDVVKYPGTWSPEFWLPERPVTAVSSVKINNLTVVTGGYTWSSYGQLYRGRLPLGNGPEWDEFDFSTAIPGANSWGGPTSEVAITYDHGYTTIPGDLRALCLAIASRSFSSPQNLQSENIGNYGYTNQAGTPVGVTLTDEEKRVCARYRRDIMSISTSG
jgi:hypothetical protein